MAEDIGKIGLDTKDVEAALARVDRKLSKDTPKAVAIADGSIKRLSASLRSLGAILGVTGLVSFVSSLRGVKDEMEATSRKFAEGSDAARDFNAATGGVTDADLKGIKRLGDQYDNLKLSIKLAGVEMLKYFSGGAAKADLKHILGLGGKPEQKAPAASESAGASMDQIAKKEREIAMLRGDGSKNYMIQQRILDEEIALLDMKIKRAEFFGEVEKKNAAIAERGSKIREKSDAVFAADSALKSEKLKTSEMKAQREGLTEVAKVLAIRLQYDQKINAALRERREDLAGELEAQKQIAIQAAKLEAIRKTTREKLDERKQARLDAADLRKAGKRDEDMARRLKIAEKEGHVLSPALRAFKAARDGAVPLKQNRAEIDAAKADAFFTQGLPKLSDIFNELKTLNQSK